MATQNYINPAIDIIKKKGLLGAELMNVSLLAMSNSLAESFIIVNSIFFGVSDIGISTVVQQSAFFGLINQGEFLKTDVNEMCGRNVLLDCAREYAHRLVDCQQRDPIFLALLGYHVRIALRKLSRHVWCRYPLLPVHRAHFPHEILEQI